MRSISLRHPLPGGLLLLVVLVVACAPPPQMPPPADPPPAVDGAAAAASAAQSDSFSVVASEVGTLRLDGDRMQFVDCESTTPRTIEDAPDGAGAALLNEFGNQPVTIMARFDGNRLQTIRYGGGEGPGCDALPPAGQVEARGNEPFWRLTVDGTTARFSTPENSAGEVFEGGAWTGSTALGWVYQSAAGERRLTLTLTEAPCSDSMSGAHFPYRAAVDLDGARLDGCGLEGRAAMQTPES